MIDRIMESYFDSMPFGLEQYGNGSLMNDNERVEDEDRFYQQDYHMVSDDHWKKFELDFPELSSIDDIFKELDSINGSSNWLESLDNKDFLFLNHDCMWAGHCSSKEHAEEPKSSLGCIIPKPPVIKKEMCSQPITKSVGMIGQQQSLLKPSVKAANTMTTTFVPPTNTSNNIIQHTLTTPPESDDEENKAHTSNLLKILNDAINECDLEDDSDLCEYFEDKSVEVKEEPIEIKEEPIDIKTEGEDTESEQDEISYQEYRIRTQMAAENDHSYHKDKNAVMRLNNYGIDTPSDSEEEEEIDVVSVSEKLTSNASRMALSLPTNPSNRDRQQLQKKVATAISRKRINNGIKTILPVRSSDGSSSSASSSSSSNSSATKTRGVKRGRGTRTNAGYKRRRTNIDGEREPSDKRHLHNDMERQRRVDLRIAFDNLKAVVPEVSGTKKIAKVNILLQAAQYCYYLTGTSMNYQKQMEDLRRKQVGLRSKLSQLRRSLAARR